MIAFSKVLRNILRYKISKNYAIKLENRKLLKSKI